MTQQATTILRVLDQCCRSSSFPMLDNGYVFLCASRLSLYFSPSPSLSPSSPPSPSLSSSPPHTKRSKIDNSSPTIDSKDTNHSKWAMVIEIFGYSPRSSIPDLHIYTFSNNIIRNSRNKDDFSTEENYTTYLANNPHNESVFYNPIDGGKWSETEVVDPEVEEIKVRDKIIKIPAADELASCNISLSDPPEIQVYELCRYVAEKERERVLATEEERRSCVAPEMKKIMTLDEWKHPDLVNEEMPSEIETFKMLAEVLATGDEKLYDPLVDKPNSHWVNWPEGGTL